MKRSALATLLLVVLFVAGCAGTRPLAEAPAGPVILVSLDGFRYDYAPHVATPTLDRIAAEGARAEWMVPAYPTLTFPNHYTIVTGLYPEHHGIVGNRFYDPERRASFSFREPATVRDSSWWGGEPIWSTAERQGVRAATVFWPGSEAAIGGVRPSFWLPYEDAMPYSARVDTLLAWLDRPAAERPRLLTLYLSAVDNAGHRYGPDAPEVDAAIQHVDSTLAGLISGLEARGLYENTTFLVVSDHGMSAMSPERVVYLDDYADVETPTEQVAWGEPTGLWPLPGKKDSLYAALRAANMPHVRVYSREDMPERLHFNEGPRVPPILLLADDGWTVTTRARVAARPLEGTWGVHGFDNEYPSMRAILYGRGPALRRGAVVPPVEAVDVYLLLTRLLGLEPAPNDGNAAATQPMLR